MNPRTKTLVVLAAAALALGTEISSQSTEQTPPLRIFLRGGPKTHGPAGNGLHDHEVWAGQWQTLLASRGAKVDSALRFPLPEQLENTDVLVMFAANAGTILGAQRASLDTFLRRGGGLVVLHDALVTAQEPHWFKTIAGGVVGERRRQVLRGREHDLLRQHRASDHEGRIEFHDHG